MSTTTDRTFAQIPNAHWGEVIRVTLSQFKGKTSEGIRVWYVDDHDETKPSNEGVNFKIELLPNIADGIHKALEAARANGLLG
jgi:Transcriptional Coactivator p15 (PC4)